VVLAVVLPANNPRDESRKLDYVGAAALASAIAPLLLAFSWAGTEYAWTSPQVLTAFAIAFVMSGVFIIAEQRAQEPIIPFSLFRNRVVAVASAITFVSGGAMFASSVYIPLFMQGVLDFSATNSGLVMTPMMLSMVCGSMISGQLVSRTGKYKWMCSFGFAVATGGMAILATMDADSSQYAGMSGMAVLGFGLGVSFTPLVLSAQNAVPYTMMGVTTSLNQFSRSVGGTIGVAIMGSILTRRLDSELAKGIPAEVQSSAPEPLLEALENPRILLDEGALAAIRDEGFAGVFGANASALFTATIDSMQSALATSIAEIFMISAVLMACSFVITLFLPEVPLRGPVMPTVSPEEATVDAAERPQSRPAPSERPASGFTQGGGGA
jgi:hypothetical protein